MVPRAEATGEVEVERRPGPAERALDPLTRPAPRSRAAAGGMLFALRALGRLDLRRDGCGRRAPGAGGGIVAGRATPRSAYAHGPLSPALAWPWLWLGLAS
jgi:hypothetical protein